MPRTAVTLCLAVLMVSLTGASARAEIISWNVTAVTNPRYVLADNHGTGGVFMTTEPWHTFTNTQSIPAAVLMAFSSAPPEHPDQLHNAAYTLTVTFRDNQTGASGKMLFHGLLNGTFSDSWYKLTNTFVGPLVQRLHLGYHFYDVALFPFDGFNVNGFGTINLYVYAHHNPEPATLVMAGLGATLMGLFGWRRSRRRQDPEVSHLDENCTA